MLLATVALLSMCAAGSPAMATGPSFNCAATALLPGAKLICSTPELSRIDLAYAQVYYVLRQQLGETGWKDLKLATLAYENDALKRCGVPASGPLPPDTQAMGVCLGQAYEQQRAAWLSHLTGPALEEARRPVELHLALQQRLQAARFLSSDAQLDGIYGVGVRTAIFAWQHANNRPETGFLSDADAALLLTAASPPSMAALTPPPVTQVQPTAAQAQAQVDQGSEKAGPEHGDTATSAAQSAPQNVYALQLPSPEKCQAFYASYRSYYFKEIEGDFAASQSTKQAYEALIFKQYFDIEINSASRNDLSSLVEWVRKCGFTSGIDPSIMSFARERIEAKIKIIDSELPISKYLEAIDSIPACDDDSVIELFKSTISNSPQAQTEGIRLLGVKDLKDVTHDTLQEDVLSGAHTLSVPTDLRRFCKADALLNSGERELSFFLRWFDEPRGQLVLQISD
jgi:hypothetical protein